MISKNASVCTAEVTSARASYINYSAALGVHEGELYYSFTSKNVNARACAVDKLKIRYHAPCILQQQTTNNACA